MNRSAELRWAKTDGATVLQNTTRDKVYQNVATGNSVLSGSREFGDHC